MKAFRISGRLQEGFILSHFHTFDQFLHPVGTAFAHLIIDMAIFVQGKRRGKVSHVFL
jgi:hypothetical protein